MTGQVNLKVGKIEGPSTHFLIPDGFPDCTIQND